MKIDYLKNVKDSRTEDIQDGIEAYTQVGKIPKKKNLKQCGYMGCKALIPLGSKSCKPHSADRRNDQLRRV